MGEVSTLLSWLSKACEACDGQGGGGMFEPGVAAELFKVSLSWGGVVRRTKENSFLVIKGCS